MHCDNAYHVAVSGGDVFFGSSLTNKVYCVDAASGEVRWTFHTEGPVRFAPTVHDGRVYVGSDDGYAYCLNARNGKLVWQYRAGPSAEKVVGNGRMISLWPVRTSVLVDRGVAYFGAGVFPYEGIFICAVDAEDGSVVWKSDTTGDRSHELEYGGISPHGYLVASDDILYVPSGRAMPAAFERESGRFLFYASPGAKTGGVWALLDDETLIAGVEISGAPRKAGYNAKTGEGGRDVFGWVPGVDMVLTEDVSYVLTLDGIYALSREKHSAVEEDGASLAEKRGELGAKLSELRATLDEADEAAKQLINSQIDQLTAQIYELGQQEERLKQSTVQWHYPREGLDALIRAGDVVFAGGKGVVIGLDAQTGSELWKDQVPGNAVGLAAADGRLIVSTDTGSVCCFGKENVDHPKTIKPAMNPSPYPDDKAAALYASAADHITEDTAVDKGYCLVLDCETGRLAFELAKRTDLQIVGIERNRKKREIARGNLEAAGLLGNRVVVESWDLSSLPDYFANLIVSDGMLTTGKTSAPAGQIMRIVRPYGGVVCFGTKKGDAVSWQKMVQGAMAGAGSWTQQFGNPQNTACSEDDLVKGPLGVLWFGEPGPERMVERHARAASPVAMNGRLFVQGEEVILAYDAYNGAALWEREIPGAVRVRADADGGNLALTEDALYVAAYDKCYRLDPATGETARMYAVPPAPGGEPRRWGGIACVDGILFGTRAVPLKHEYAAIWKELAPMDALPDPHDMPDDTREVLESDRYFWRDYEGFRAKYETPDVDVQRDLHRYGTDWRIVTDFPYGENHHLLDNPATGRMMTGDMVFATNPGTGEVLWRWEGSRIANITVTIGDGILFFAEANVTEEQRARAVDERRRLVQEGVYREFQQAGGALDIRMVVALDAATGKMLWQRPVDLTGCCGDSMGGAYRDGVLLFFGNTGSHDAWRFRDGELRYKRIVAMSAEDGAVLWSRPLNYRTRPLIVGDTIIIEPRACDLRTGVIATRSHPVSGQTVPWEFLRPGHTCAITSASAHALFYRSAFTAFYDLDDDRGVISFGGIRPGCLINLIPASGLLLFPEASSGCTCSYPLRCSVALKRKPDRPQPWTVFVTHGDMTPAQHFAINLGAPADMKDDAGTVWFGYPNPVTSSFTHFPGYGVKFDLHDESQQDMGYFRRDFRDARVSGTDKPWLFTSGHLGPFRCRVPLINPLLDEAAGRYRVRLGFMAPAGDRPGVRVFEVKVGDEVIEKGFDIVQVAGGPNTAVVLEFRGVRVNSDLAIELVPAVSSPMAAQAPIINFIEAIREDPVPEKEAVSVALLTEAEAEAMLSAARTDPPEQAIDRYHHVLDGTRSVALQRQALGGMAAIGSTKSLPWIARFSKDAPTILWDYEEPAQELRGAALHVHVAVANNLAETDRERAVQMLQDALSVSGWDMRVDVCDALARIGVEVGAEAAEEGFVTRWCLVGPFPWDRANNPLSKDFVNEPQVNLDGTYSGLEGETVRWRRYLSGTRIVDLPPLFGSLSDCAVYAYGEFALDEDRDVLLKIGSNDGFRCWVNGQEVGRFDGGRACRPDQDILEVKGRKGKNAVLLKITQMGAAWGFCARVTDVDNVPIRYREEL